MNYQTHDERGYRVLSVEGDIKTSEARKFEENLIMALSEGQKVILDLTQVAYTCSAGLRALLAGQQYVDDHEGSDLIIRNINNEVMSVLKSTGLVNVLNII